MNAVSNYLEKKYIESVESLYRVRILKIMLGLACMDLLAPEAFNDLEPPVHDKTGRVVWRRRKDAADESMAAYRDAQAFIRPDNVLFKFICKYIYDDMNPREFSEKLRIDPQLAGATILYDMQYEGYTGARGRHRAEIKERLPVAHRHLGCEEDLIEYNVSNTCHASDEFHARRTEEASDHETWVGSRGYGWASIFTVDAKTSDRFGNNNDDDDDDDGVDTDLQPASEYALRTYG